MPACRRRAAPLQSKAKPAMMPEEMENSPAVAVNPFANADVAAILQERGWATGELSAEQVAWCEHAVAILGTQVTDREALAELLGLVFHYDSRELLARVESHAVLSRYAARDVLRQLALLLLEGTALDSERFKTIIAALKERLDIRGRELFHPIRLALAGRAGEGELDRVILLLDEAAGASFTVRVKTARERILEFCAALD
jgi:nondiscriminating glutamyl-tRNA synthetase